MLTIRPFVYIIVAVSLFVSCVDDSYREQAEPDAGITKQEQVYKNLRPQIAKRLSQWKGNKFLFTDLEIRNMQLRFGMEIKRMPPDCMPVAGKDTFRFTVIKLEVLFNNKPILFEIKDPDKSWLKQSKVVKAGESLQFNSENTDISKYSQINLDLPLYAFSGIKAGTKGIISVHVWQDYFLTDEKERSVKMADDYQTPEYYRDTLKKRLIDNSYSFEFTIPEIYKTQIICDSIVLQNDQNWSPAGSDNTIWKSSYPDIYFTLSDLYNNTQASSVTEKSTAKYTLGDSLEFYHYAVNEPLQICVYDYDVLSKDDVLGTWHGNLKNLDNKKKYRLRFGHIDYFALRVSKDGMINK